MPGATSGIVMDRTLPDGARPSPAVTAAAGAAQAAVICLYELYLATLTDQENADIKRADAEQIERLFDIIRNSLLKIGFLDSENPEHMLLAFRRIFGRAGLEEKDVRILAGMFRQIEWYAKEGWRVVQDKEQRGIKIR